MCPPWFVWQCIPCRGGPAPNSSEGSVFDKWSLTHFLTGVLTSIPVFFIDAPTAFLITFTWAVVWEIFENTLGARLWRSGGCPCQDQEYFGDHPCNSLGDIFSNSLGFLLMYALS